MPRLPDSIRRGLTARRLRAILQKPVGILENARLHLFADASEEEHIFVVGPPRSGTTLVMSILASHPRIASLQEETYFFLRWNYTDFRLPDIPDSEMKEFISSARSYIDLFDRIARFTKDRQEKDFFLEKTPEHAIVLDLLLDKYPRSQFVAIIRDPRDGYLSARRNPELDNWTLENYCEDWRQCTENVLTNSESPRLEFFRYEDLCTDPDSVSRKMMSHVGLDLHSNQLDPDQYGAKTSLSGRKGHERLSRRISDDTVGRWKDEISQTDLRQIENICADEMDKLGYTV